MGQTIFCLCQALFESPSGFLGSDSKDIHLAFAMPMGYSVAVTIYAWAEIDVSEEGNVRAAPPKTELNS
jgi:hypothetical protein